MECDKEDFLLFFDGDSKSLFLLPESTLEFLQVGVCAGSVLHTLEHLRFFLILVDSGLISFSLILNNFDAGVSYLILN